MPSILVFGEGAERAAAALIRSLRPSPIRAAYLAPDGSPPGSCDFVAADGRFLPNAALWLEWATGQPLPVAVPQPSPEDSVLVIVAPDSARIRLNGVERIDATTLPVYADRFGRPCLTPSRDEPAEGCRIGLLGDAHHHRFVYPAVLAQLGDAADRTGIMVEPVIVSAEDDLAGLHGMILPGGADMGQVTPQIAIAEQALATGLPLLGLCLGMQSMTTALLRAALWPEATFEEIDGPGPYRGFVRLRGPDGAGLHRTGEHRFRPKPGTRLAALLPDGAALRMNHRYRFNPEIDTAGIPGAVPHWSGDILDAIEVPSHPFFIGLQGHPEIGCDPALAGLWDGFLGAARTQESADAR